MLFPYTYLPHQMEKMQEFIDFIFHDVWCKAPTGGTFHLDLFLGNPDLHHVMEAFSISDTKGGDFFYSHVERIYDMFAHLPLSEIGRFKQWYEGNNDIEKVCANDPAIQIVRYEELAVAHKDLSGQIASFFKGLYSESLLGLAVMRGKIGDINDHYKKFVTLNAKGKCPFCGMNDLLSEDHSKREAYDHYLPKAIYPFNTINFRNLVPACHHCNSSYKLSKNPNYQPKHPTHKPRGNLRRKAFFPFSTQPHSIEITVDLHSSDVMKLSPTDVTLQYGPAEISEEINTWREVYGIDERYKAKFCGQNDGKYWFLQATEEWGGGPIEMLAALRRTARPFGDCNFLKKPFLEACERVGLFKTALQANTTHAPPSQVKCRLTE